MTAGGTFPTGTILNRYGSPVLPDDKPSRSGARIWQQYQETRAGTKVTDEDQMSIDAVLTCARVLAESMACLPLDLKRRKNGERDASENAVDDPLYELVRWQPNDEMTAYEFRHWLMFDAIFRGVGVGQVVKNGRGRVLEMWPLERRYLKPKRVKETGKLVFTYSPGGSKTDEILFEKEELLLIQVMPYGGILGYAMIDLMRQTFGQVKATEEYTAEFFKNGGVMTGFLEVPDELGEEAYERLKKEWKERNSGPGRRHGVPILEGGSKFNPVTLNHQESQLLESRKFTRSIVAGLFRVPAHLINDLEKATFSNIEHQDLGFVKHSLRPWMTNWEQRCRMTLLTRLQRSTMYFKHNDRDLLRGDMASRFEAYNKAINAGFMNPNDARAAEDMPGYEGGDTYYVNGTLRPTNVPYTGGAAAALPAPQPNPQS